MRTQNLSVDLSGATVLLDTTGVDLDLEPPEGVELRPCEPAEVADLTDGAALMILAGPNGSVHSDRVGLEGLLSRLPVGGRAVLLLGWAAEDLPGHWLLDLLAERRLRIEQVSRPEFESVEGIEAVLTLSRPADPPAGLAAANLDAMTEFGIVRLKDQVSQLTGELNRARRGRTAAESTVARIESSASFRAGQALVSAARSPIKGVVGMPRDLARIWRDRRTRQARRRPVSADGTMTVPIALPSTGAAAGRPALITLTAPAAMIVPRHLAADGLVGYEPSSLACFLAATDVAAPGAVFDIGANVGIYAALASAMTDRPVCAFEPWPVLVDVARRFSEDNKLGFTTEAIALGAENGDATLYLSDASDSSNSLNESFRSSSHQIQVPVETLDSYVDRTGTVPAVLKVDTETTEPQVLTGGLETIAKHRPWILAEVLAGRVEPELEQVLAPLGYRWYHITDEVPLRESVRIVGDASYADMMWLFAPEKPGEEFWAAVRARRAALSACTAAHGRRLHAA